MTDKEYVKRRKKLIPTAEAHANQVAGPRPESKRSIDLRPWWAAWNRAFHTMMNTLAREAGLAA